MQLLINLDVPDLAAAEHLYCSAFGLRPGRRLGAAGLELLGAAVPLYLLAQPAGSPGGGGQARDYARHWTPLHLDVVVDDLEAALARALACGFRADDLPGGPQDLASRPRHDPPRSLGRPDPAVGPVRTRLVPVAVQCRRL